MNADEVKRLIPKWRAGIVLHKAAAAIGNIVPIEIDPEVFEGLLDRVEELERENEAEYEENVSSRAHEATLIEQIAALKAENARLRTETDEQEKMLCRQICFMVEAAGIEVDDPDNFGVDDAVEAVRRKFLAQSEQLARLKEKGDRLAKMHDPDEDHLTDEIDEAVREWEAECG